MNKPLSKLNIFSAKGIQMRTFHITWVTFFFCFFGWFGIAPLMPVVREQLGLNKEQVGNIIIASVSATIIARLVIGKLCDSLGPRLSYTILLLVGSIPVIGIGLSNSYESFLLFRFMIGIIGASFVITQFHTSMMFAPNVIGTANAVSGGWGNLGGGVTNLAMPLIASVFVSLGFSTEADSWRYAMIIPGVILIVMAFIYFKYTKDTPAGNFREISRAKKVKTKGTFTLAMKDYRTWALAFAYAACFGIEITVDNVAATFFVDNYNASLILAGALAASFGLMNIFARALGGYFSDKVGQIYGLRGKGLLLGLFLVLEGIGIAYFAQAGSLTAAIVAMLIFALFLKMANGGTYSIVPFVNKKAIGSVSGIVGAGGNIGAMLAGFLFKATSITYADAFLYLGIAVVVIGVIIAVIPFETETSRAEADVLDAELKPTLQTV
ncbi:MFS transporter [Pedobacter sp. SYSU D00535]|uniref:MFS transporter n=1 Tax=Pedobacter sp. SYSU D00535 TaxID=2810308 RepID=UPI001A96F311|nr:MFS transporter [Pedobacter sp. SYSU D00535]